LRISISVFAYAYGVFWCFSGREGIFGHNTT
jgi:hypothetical protein